MSAAALVLSAVLLGPGASRPVSPAAEPPPATSAAERAERIEVALGMIHGGPSPAAWRALGPEAVPSLERLARDPAELPSRRARALDGLSHLGGERAAAVLRELSGADRLPYSVRAAALRGAGRVLPGPELERALEPVLRGASRAADRAVAAEVLAERVPDAGCRALRSRLPLEAERDRGTFERARARCASGGR
jgi:hypothetical protein